jgi:predicted Zn-dependent peptidase
MRDELSQMLAEGIEPVLLERTIGWITQSQRLYLQTPDQIAALHSRPVEQGHDPGYGRARANRLLALRVPDVEDVARRYLSPAALTLVGAGQHAHIAPALAHWASESP